MQQEQDNIGKYNIDYTFTSTSRRAIKCSWLPTCEVRLQLGAKIEVADQWREYNFDPSLAKHNAASLVAGYSIGLPDAYAVANSNKHNYNTESQLFLLACWVRFVLATRGRDKSQILHILKLGVL